MNNELMQRLLSLVPAPSFAREYQKIETTIVEVCMLVPGPYTRIQQACREVAAHYPVPAYQTIGRLVTELATNQPTELVQGFWREYGNAKTKEQAE